MGRKSGPGHRKSLVSVTTIQDGDFIEAEMGFQRRGYCDGIAGICWRRMRHGHNGDDFAALDHLPCGNNRARPVLAALFGAGEMFVCPQVGIGNHKPRGRGG